MPDPAPPQDDAVRAVYAFAGERLDAGDADHEVENQLVAKGIEPGAAAKVVADIRELQSRTRSELGRKHVRIGGILILLGAVGVGWAYSSGMSGEGSYLLFLGAIVFGVIQCSRGSRLSRG